jgi:hypothetical protein
MGIPVRRSILMGTASRRKPTRLGEKILHIRNALGLSQNEMIARMGLTEELSLSIIFPLSSGMCVNLLFRYCCNMPGQQEYVWMYWLTMSLISLQGYPAFQNTKERLGSLPLKKAQVLMKKCSNEMLGQNIL